MLFSFNRLALCIVGLLLHDNITIDIYIATYAIEPCIKGNSAVWSTNREFTTNGLTTPILCAWKLRYFCQINNLLAIRLISQ